jgi:hypothetical protein
MKLDVDLDDKIQNLLAQKARPSLSPDYIRSFQAEFHRRQRAQSMKLVSPWEAWRNQWEAAFTSITHLDSGRYLALASAMAVLVLGLGFGAWTGVQSLPQSKSAVNYAFDDVRQSAPDQETSIVAKALVPAHYIFQENQAPVQVALAF